MVRVVCGMSEVRLPKIYQLPDGQECCIVEYDDDFVVILEPRYLASDMDYIEHKRGKYARIDKMSSIDKKRVAEYFVMKALGFDLDAIRTQ